MLISLISIDNGSFLRILLKSSRTWTIIFHSLMWGSERAALWLPIIETFVQTSSLCHITSGSILQIFRSWIGKLKFEKVITRT